MAGHGAILSYHANKNCFVNLPSGWVSKLNRDKIIVYELQAEGGSLFTSWAGGISVSSNNGLDTVEVNGLFAIKHNINHGDELLIREVYPVPACTQVFVEPLSITDWEILEENSQHIENNMLSQVRVVWIGQIIPLWIQKSICIFVKIGKTVPQSKCCLLEQNTEVIVMPKVRNMHQHAPTDTSGKEMSSNTGESDYAGDVRDQVRDRCDFKSGDSDNHNDRLDVEGHNSSDLNPNQIRTRHLSGNKFVEDLRQAAVDYEEVTKSRRSSICSCSDNNSEEDKGCSSRTQNTQPDSLMGKTVTFMKWLWSGERSTQTESPLIAVERSNQKPYNKEYLDGTFDCGLRVQSLDSVVDGFEGSDNTHVKRPADLQWQHNNLLLHQPCNVFITQKTFAANYVINSRDFLPRTFLATLTKLLSPAEKQDLANKRSQAEKEQLAKMARQLASPASGSKEFLNPEQEDKTNFVVRIVILEHGATFEKVPGSGTDPSRSLSRASDGHVMMPDALRCQLNLEVTAKVRVTAFKQDDHVPTRITCHPLFTLPAGYTSDMLLSAITSWVEMTSDQCCPLVMNKETVINIPLKPDYSGYFLLTCMFSADQDSHYCLLDMTTLQRIKLVVESEIPQQKLPLGLRALSQGDCCHMDLPVPKINLDQLGGVAAHIQQAVLHIDMCLAQRPLTDTMFTHKPGLHNGGLLLCGQKGLGKSSLASALCRYASRWPNWAYVVVVHCKSLKGKRIENIRKLFEKVFHEAVWRQPSVILLDDLDHVTAAPSGPEQEMSGEALYYTRVSEALKDILNETMRNNAKVIAIATSRSRSSIHPSLVASRGKHYFQEFLEMMAPNKTGRVAILKSILLNKPVVNAQCIDVLDLDSLAGRTEGHVPGDLDMVVDRAIHAHRMHPKSDDSDELNLCEADFDLALTDFVPTSLKSVTLHKPGEVGWQNIGGLTRVKKTLIETLQWPAKYSKLFASCPLRLRSGLLLYGAPGTGKTLLAGAVAKECGLNFISIKGPELLSKYIGASEQAVRDTFLRAQSAKPCILFFDEFDSLAPRRGHDSTGVTDRVVNQLLTQLDGVEGLEGVYVLGATSRPDLLDPALLRPGRLDKALYCPIPEQHERLEILHSLTHKMNLDPSVDLAHFAEACEGYTGADLKALLYNAQLESIHELTGYSSVTSDRTQLSQVTAEPRQLSNMTAGQPSPADDNRDGQTADTDNLTLVVEKIPVKRLSYIKKLEDGCLTLTPEEEQQHLSQFSDIVAPSSECANKDSAVTVIKQCHLVKALEGMRPSVSAEERKKYQMIYEHFVGSRGGNFTMERSAIGKKATLA